MNTYLAIITTVLVITQIIRLIQNAVQLRRQNILFKEQLGQIQDVTQEDFDIQRKAYRLMVEYFESRKLKTPIIGKEKRNVVNVHAKTELDDMIASHEPGLLEKNLKLRLGEEVMQYATVRHKSDPLNYTVGAEAVVSVLDKAVNDT